MDKELKKAIDEALIETFRNWCTADEFEHLCQHFWRLVNRAVLPIARDGQDLTLEEVNERVRLGIEKARGPA